MIELIIFVFKEFNSRDKGLKLLQGHEDSEYMLSFEIGQRESCFYDGRTDGHTHPVP